MGLLFNYFPHMQIDSNNQSWIWIADVLKDESKWTWENMRSYNSIGSNGFAAAFVQLLHRGTAYLLCFLIPIFFMYLRRIHHSKELRRGSIILMLLLIAQVFLGIFTLLNGIGQVPLMRGVLHQAGGLLLLAAMLYVVYQFSKGGDHIKIKNNEVEGTVTETTLIE